MMGKKDKGIVRQAAEHVFDLFRMSNAGGALVFHCNTCEANWPPTKEEIAKMRKGFSESSA